MTPQVPTPDVRRQSHLRTAAVAMAIVAACSGGPTAQDARPLPSMEVLYQTVRDNLSRAERVAYLYAFKERRTDVHTNPFGRLGTDGTRLIEVYPSATRQLTYRRVIERNDVPIPAQELKDQDEEYRARAADIQRLFPAGSEEERARREADAARARQRGQRRVDAVVEALQFKVEGRSMYEGVPAIVVSFTPKPSAKPETREARIAHNFAGTVWIHEAAGEVMHVEAKSIDDITFGLGLIARVGKGTEASFTRRPIEPNLWMPTHLGLKGRGRAAVFRTLVLDFAVTWFDYRRLDGDSATPFLDSRVQRQPDRSP